MLFRVMALKGRKKLRVLNVYWCSRAPGWVCGGAVLWALVWGNIFGLRRPRGGLEPGRCHSVLGCSAPEQPSAAGCTFGRTPRCLVCILWFKLSFCHRFSCRSPTCGEKHRGEVGVVKTGSRHHPAAPRGRPCCFTCPESGKTT